MRSLFIALTWILGIVGFAVLAFAYDDLARKTAHLDGDDAAVWLYTPHVGPGGTLRGEVGVYGGIQAGISRARIAVGGAEAEMIGRGRHWGASIRTKSTTSGSDDVEFEIALPAGLSEGEAATLIVDVEYVRARRSMGGFSNDRDAERLELALPIRSPIERVALRVWSAARAIAVWLVLVWGYLRYGPALTRDDPEMSESQTEGLAYLILCVLVFVGMAGYPLFALPLMAATHVTADAFVVGAVILWVVGPPITAWRIHKARPATTGWTVRMADSAAHPDLERVARAMSVRRDLTTRVRRDTLHARIDRRQWVRLKATRGANQWAGGTVESTEPTLVFALARTLAEAGGPLTLTTPYVELTVDRSTTMASLEEQHTAQLQAAIERMMAVLEESQATIDAMLDRKP